jgi:hypothetical protein
VTYYCQCYLGYAGFNCQESIKILKFIKFYKFSENFSFFKESTSPCLSRPCLNGGSCVNNENNTNYTCLWYKNILFLFI